MMCPSTLPSKRITWPSFLKDVFICSLGAYGGPEAHYGVFLDQLVVKKNYLDEEEFVELMALCSILPGPTSTQTIISVGYKTGGPVLAFLTWMVWALPVITAMTILSFLYQFLQARDLSYDLLRYIGPMAVGFIVFAAYRIGKKVLVDRLTWVLFAVAAVTTYFVRTPWIFPTVLLLGGLVSVMASGQENLWQRVDLRPPWPYFLVFAGLALFGIFATLTWDLRLVHLFESFYRYGYLVFGGGQVVVPVMYAELVEGSQYMTGPEFLTGYGLVQGLPGPMFSFAAYAGGMAASGGGMLYQVAGALLGALGIFLPGILLIYFVYPIWEKLKEVPGVKISLKGINALAGGLIAISAVILLEKSGLAMDHLLLTLVTIFLLSTRKVPAPVLVLGTLILGVLL